MKLRREQPRVRNKPDRLGQSKIARPSRKQTIPSNSRAVAGKSMLRYSFIMGALAFGLAACGTAPFDAPTNSKGYPTVRQVVQKIACEIAEARDDPNINKDTVQFEFGKQGIAAFTDWVVAVTLTLTVNDTEGFLPTGSGLTLSFINTLKSTGHSFGFAGSPILYQQRARTYTETYTLYIRKIDRAKECNGTQLHDFNLEGDLGIKDQIYLGLHSFTNDPAETYATPPKTPAAISAAPPRRPPLLNALQQLPGFQLLLQAMTVLRALVKTALEQRFRSIFSRVYRALVLHLRSQHLRGPVAELECNVMTCTRLR
jgi:hypothetical protein